MNIRTPVPEPVEGQATSCSGDKKIPLFESHILNFNQDLYGQKVKIELTDFIRDEKKFASIDELKKQIEMDVVKAGFDASLGNNN